MWPLAYSHQTTSRVFVLNFQYVIFLYHIAFITKDLKIYADFLQMVKKGPVSMVQFLTYGKMETALFVSTELTFSDFS